MASILDILVCMCSSTRFSLAVSLRIYGSTTDISRGFIVYSFSNVSSVIFPEISTVMPFSSGLSAFASLFLRYVLTLYDHVLSVMQKLMPILSPFLVSRRSKSNTLPQTITLSLKGVIVFISIGLPLISLPSSTTALAG